MEKKKIHLFTLSLHQRQSGFFTLFLFLFFHSHAQEFGGNPPSLKWKQLNTDTARIIFPESLESDAREISSLVHQLAAMNQHQLGNSMRKVNIVLQNQNTFSNGYVALGPFRSEFFLTPRQNSFELGSLPWRKTLALHEYRHVLQYNNFRKGLSKAFYYLFGEEGQALANSVAIPDWFYEGDAVYQETKFSDQGRGNISYFFNGYRSLWAADKNYPWMKLRNGSYRDFIPDHYQLGYMLVNYGYQKYGDEAWKKITSDAAAFKGLFYPFQRSFKRNSSQRFTSFTKEALDHYKQSSPANLQPDEPAKFAKAHRHFVADEQFPHWIDDSRIVFLKSTYRNIPSFYIRDVITGSETKVRNKSISTADYFSCNGNSIIYSAFQQDPRWGWKNYEVIRVIDIESGKERTVTAKSRYLSPDISKKGNSIVAVHADVSGKNELHLLDAVNGKIIKVMPNLYEYVFTYPKFYNDDTVVAAVRNGKGEMALGKFSLATGMAEWLKPFAFQIIAFPQVYNDTVFFSMQDDNIDRLFAAAGGKVFQFQPSVSNQFTGNYQLCKSDGRYAWVSYTAVGFHLYYGTGKFIEYNSASIPADRPVLITGARSVNAEVKKYPSTFKLFNFHSWRPFINDPEYSYSLVSENILNTLQSEIFFTYNRNEKYKETGASLSYGGLYPVINGGGSFTFDRSFTDSAKRIEWNEYNARIGMNVPLFFTHGTFSQSVNAAATFNANQVYYTGASKMLYQDKHFNYGDFVFSATNQQLRARQNIYPRHAQVIFARYRKIINAFTAYQLLLNGTLYLPGLHQNHNIVLQASYQQRDTVQQYNFPNSFPFSRGYPDFNYPRMWKLGANYHFPIAYPDLGFASIVYLLRVRGNIFYDHSEVKSLRTGIRLPFRTAGTELYFDTRWWNQLPVNFGIRYSRLLDAADLGISSNQWELVLPLDLLSR